MSGNKWAATDRVMRDVHLYTGLFLIPWMLVYAVSAFCLNHGPWINKTFKIAPPTWQVVREEKLAVSDAFPREREEQARAILRKLDLEGAHRIQSKPGALPLIILRPSGGGNYRITWRPHQGRIIVEKQQPFSFLRMVHFLHFRGGYAQRYAANVIWAITVDVVAISMLFWVISGVYIWARRPRKRLFGSACLIAGGVLFIILAILLCR